MRILFLTNLYPPFEIGGFEQLCHEIASCLIDRGHIVSILTSNYGIKNGAINDTPSITRSLHLQTDLEYYRPLDFFTIRSDQESKNIIEVRKQLDQIKPDIVMIWGMWNLSHNIPYSIEQSLRGRTAYYISSYWPIDTDPHTAYWELPARRPLFEIGKKALRRYVLMKLHQESYPPKLAFKNAVCCSEYVRNKLVVSGSIPKESGVVALGIDPDPYINNSIQSNKQKDDCLKLLYFGRLIYDKGVHTAIEALGILRQQVELTDIELTILGSGHPEYERELRKMVVDLDVEQQVKFASQVPRDEIPEWLSKFDAYLFTSIWPEPMARSVMEAMAAGLLVIGTEVGGQTEMLRNNQNALTFAPGDARALAKHIICIRNNPELRLQLASAGKKMILERFTLKRMVDEIEQYLQDIVTKNPLQISEGPGSK